MTVTVKESLILRSCKKTDNSVFITIGKFFRKSSCNVCGKTATAKITCNTVLMLKFSFFPDRTVIVLMSKINNSDLSKLSLFINKESTLCFRIYVSRSNSEYFFYNRRIRRNFEFYMYLSLREDIILECNTLCNVFSFINRHSNCGMDNFFLV